MGPMTPMTPSPLHSIPTSLHPQPLAGARSDAATKLEESEEKKRVALEAEREEVKRMRLENNER
jgi:hypothetical protein